MTGHLATARWLALAALATWAGAVSADMPPLCPMDEGNAALRPYGSYTPYQYRDGFVSLTVHGSNDRDRVWAFQHCASGQQLVVVARDGRRVEDLSDAVGQRLDAMFNGAEPYTLGEVRDAMTALGARATVSQLDGQSCGCATHGYERD